MWQILGSDVLTRQLRRDLSTQQAELTSLVPAAAQSPQRRAGLPQATGALYILRHTFCSHLAMRGAPAKAIQELAGHEDLATTLRYMHVSPAARESAIALLNRRVQGSDFGDIVEPEVREGRNLGK
jgi:site-specific recombinase XerD